MYVSRPPVHPARRRRSASLEAAAGGVPLRGPRDRGRRFRRARGASIMEGPLQAVPSDAPSRRQMCSTPSIDVFRTDPVIVQPRAGRSPDPNTRTIKHTHTHVLVRAAAAWSAPRFHGVCPVCGCVRTCGCCGRVSLAPRAQARRYPASSCTGLRGRRSDVGDACVHLCSSPASGRVLAAEEGKLFGVSGAGSASYCAVVRRWGLQYTSMRVSRTRRATEVNTHPYIRPRR
ncbi:hypothetical protein C8Q77DRAFT_83841 [Trametes polyzona]|nr:hypothetical protein C8Q77DRAFT_83841 [Trametes polyzona]